jgi:hypothetical protein
MKIDNLIELLKPNTKEVVLFLNKKTIDSFFEDIEIDDIYVTTINVENPKNTRSIYRNGFTIHFLESKTPINL